MKKLLVLLLVLVFTCSVFASCEYLPDEVNDALAPILEKLGLAETPEQPDTGDETPDVPAHEHEYTLSDESKKATCSRDGKNVYVCSCGDSYEESVTAFGHDFKVTSVTKPSCTVKGGTKYKCNNCGYSKTESTDAIGHDFEDAVEASRLIPCRNENCSYAKFPESDGKYKEELVYKFTDSDIERFNTIHAEIGALIEAADAYDPALHSYVEGSELEELYLALEDKYWELDDILAYVTGQYQIAQVEYHVSMNDEKKANYDYISEVRTDLVTRFYAYSQAIYDSMYRDYFYYGMTEEEIKAYIAESDAVSNPEYKELVDRNNEIELEFTGIPDPTTSELVPELYAEFVANNKRIAEILDYDNYLEYAYEVIYDRDYSYTDVQAVAEYVKTYISSLYTSTYSKWNAAVSSYTNEQLVLYNSYISGSFFTDYEANKNLNDYIDLLEFNSNPDRHITFSDEFNGLMSNGNLFRGKYNGAYVTTVYGLNIPIAYFGLTNSGPFTVAHEFGHYMNEIYNEENYSQSYDLLEMHSQGNELLFLSYLKDLESINEKDLVLVETYQVLIALDSVLNALAVDTFEQAVYTDSYDGAYSDEIMADGVISADEYDLLYESVLVDFGIDDLAYPSYWRYMTITSPCYYVSYSVSALSALQLYVKAESGDFDGAVDSYLKLFTYVDELDEENDYMSTDEVLRYAGLYSFHDEDLYVYLSRNLK
jgi:hypothetical protein